MCREGRESNGAKVLGGEIEFSRGGKAIDRPSLPRCNPTTILFHLLPQFSVGIMYYSWLYSY
jgi:hypothetical protein